jgi:putative oxidoreductase
MKVLVLICQILLGLVFVFFGLNGLFQFLHAPLPPRGTPVGDFANVFHDVGWTQVVAALEVIGGALVWYTGTVPLGLCILCPITVNVWLFHILFHAVSPQMIMTPILVTIFEIVLLYAYRDSFAGIWTWTARPRLDFNGREWPSTTSSTTSSKLR